MKQLTSAEIRQMWLDFWKSKGHSVEPSASLVPVQDPSLLWINSGVATLKKYFDGSVVPENPRITNSQKSIRTNDIENVGVTARHHTLFEMLGNFSIGDYFKEEVIPWAWEFLTDEKWLALEPEKLYMTYYPEDTETVELWRQATDLSDDHFVPVEDNFWDLGVGPCGPDTEIFYDRGEKYQDLEDSDPEMYPGGENERYLEIWNIVFSQFNHMPNGEYVPLKQKNIDTGMGLERMTSVIQDAPTNFETDLFLPIIKKIETLGASVKYGEKAETDVSFKVIADHVRAVTFAISDRALPSNEGRGYILRRLIRRAIMHGRRLGIKDKFLVKLVPVVADIMADFYPEVKDDQDFIQDVIDTEENRFNETINEGEAIIQEVISSLEAAHNKMMSGAQAFKLYDTYGFPLELTQEYLEEVGIDVDLSGFEEAMKAQRERARAARKDSAGMGVQSEVLSDIDVVSTYVGYDQLTVETRVNTIVSGDAIVSSAEADEEIYLVVEQTPFYAEMGGQVADTGDILDESGQLIGQVVNVVRAPNGQHLHEVKLEAAVVLDQIVQLVVDRRRHHSIEKNHTATHLLHQALKDVLGDHANQAGSLVTAGHLRFDFSHFGQVTDNELAEMEAKVNEAIAEAYPVVTTVTSIEEAKAAGAQALFGEKYGSEVRMVDINHWSIELCGGTHVANTAEIGLFKIISESGIGAGVRRIEAVTSLAAIQEYKKQENILKQIAENLKAKSFLNIVERLQQFKEDHKETLQQLSALRDKMNAQAAVQIFDHVETAGAYTVIAEHVPNRSMEELRKIADEWKQKDSSDILVLATSRDDKANLLVAVGQDAVKSGIKAGDLVKQIAPKVGGGGGGRSDMAQAGGKNPAGIREALAFAKEIISK
ncbi:alanine--tRNA ligase [Aerococcus sp. HMSC10H05]|uniref:alanine--tRNA ligase n=1 Tax=Aerococcus sp. HMSC10H05 TaxID=1581084 RepID=UPI0008A5CE66|nr:alanine--tRNA ligase [Aerococcus sp. HMSC10H05]OFU52825.1 alanine--tRNA ligase [Aerococcus sp. HMSC10H05]